MTDSVKFELQQKSVLKLKGASQLKEQANNLSNIIKKENGLSQSAFGKKKSISHIHVHVGSNEA